MESRVIGVVSGKGGVGKTTSVVNISAALSGMNKNVVAVDADAKMSGLALQLGMHYFPVTLNDVLRDAENLSHSIYIHSSGLRIIPSSLCLRNCSMGSLNKILNEPLLKDAMVLVDGPPGLEENGISVMNACKNILIVTEPELPAVSNVMKIIKLSNEKGINVLGIIINKYRKDKNQINKKEIESACGVPIIGVVPEDNNVKKSVFKRSPVVISSPYSPASIAYKKIASKLIGQQYIADKNLFKRMFSRF